MSTMIIYFAGRCARAGRTGTAYNIVSSDEYPYLLDLHLFLGRPLTIVPTAGTIENMESAIGKLPQAMVEEELAELINWHNTSTDLVSIQSLSTLVHKINIVKLFFIIFINVCILR